MTPPGPPPAPAAALPPGMIKLDFRGTEIDTVLQAFALAYKWTVVKDPSLTGPVTVIETTPMNQKRAFQVLQAVLEVRGFTAMLDGSILKVMPLKRAISSTTNVRLPGADEVMLENEQVVTEVIALSNAEASVIAKDLQPLLTEGASLIGAAGANALIVTDHASNIRKVKAVIGALDKGAGNNEMEIFRLKHVPAKQMSTIINDLFKQIAPRTPPPPMGQPGQPFPQPMQGGAKSEARPAVAAVEDTRTNSVIVIGSGENLKKVAELVQKLDDELNPHTETKVYEVKFAEAQRLAQLVNDALLKDPAASGASQPQGNPFGFFNPFERRAQGTQTTSFSAGQTRIVADTRANKLIITADQDIMKVVEQLLAELDNPVDYETTTFVIKLKNQHAEDMAYVLAQAFGTQQQSFGGFGFFGGFNDFGGQGGQQSRKDKRIRRRLDSEGNNRSDASGGGGLNVAGGPATGFKPGDPAGTRFADASGLKDLPPGSEQLAQFFFDGFFGGRRGSDATTGRTNDGKYVNLLQLRNNVLVNAERNTNSLIITTTPENAQAVRELVSDLDIETKQVLLEAIVAEVSLDNTTKFGVDYLFSNMRDKLEGIFPVLPGTGPLGGTADALASGLRATILRGDVRIIATALGRDEKIRILSTPSVFTSNNQEAEIDVTDRIPYLGGSTASFGQTTSNTAFLDVGLILNVTPRITVDGMVTVDVYQEDSNLVEFRNIGQNTVAPLTTQRVTDTSVTLRDGDTLVLSGLQKDQKITTKNKIPFLGDLPVLGNLFRSNTRQNRRTELLVFLTPRVVHSADEARDLTGEHLKELEKRIPDAKKRIPSPKNREPELEPIDPREENEKNGKKEKKEQ